jgi:hypothetical protein
MCVKLIKGDQLINYDSNRPLMEQVYDVKEVVVQYKPKDKSVETFLQEMQKCVKYGVNPGIKVKVEYNDFLKGYKTKKQIIKAMNDITLNEIIKLVALMQHGIDKTLEEIAASCANR